MQIIKSLFKLVIFICPFVATAQSTYLPEGDKGYHFVDRLEIKQQTNTDLNFSTLKPYSRKYIVQQAEYLDSIRKQSANSLVVAETDHLKFTKLDAYNMNSFLMNNSEWVTGSKESFLSKKPFWGAFYKTKPNLLDIRSAWATSSSRAGRPSCCPSRLVTRIIRWDASVW